MENENKIMSPSLLVLQYSLNDALEKIALQQQAMKRDPHVGMKQVDIRSSEMQLFTQLSEMANEYTKVMETRAKAKHSKQRRQKKTVEDEEKERNMRLQLRQISSQMSDWKGTSRQRKTVGIEATAAQVVSDFQKTITDIKETGRCGTLESVIKCEESKMEKRNKTRKEIESLGQEGNQLMDALVSERFEGDNQISWLQNRIVDLRVELAKLIEEEVNQKLKIQELEAKLNTKQRVLAANWAKLREAADNMLVEQHSNTKAHEHTMKTFKKWQSFQEKTAAEWKGRIDSEVANKRNTLNDLTEKRKVLVKDLEEVTNCLRDETERKTERLLAIKQATEMIALRTAAVTFISKHIKGWICRRKMRRAKKGKKSKSKRGKGGKKRRK